MGMGLPAYVSVGNDEGLLILEQLIHHACSPHGQLSCLKTLMSGSVHQP